MSKFDIKKVYKDFQESLPKVAEILGKEPSEVTMAEFIANDPLEINYSHLKSAGGFTSLKKLYFPPEKSIVSETAAKLVSSHRNKLEKKYGQELFLKEEFESIFTDIMTNTTMNLHQPTKKLSIPKNKKARTIVAHMSDLHYGCKVDEEELGSLNRWDWVVAARRTALFMEQVVMYKLHYRNETDLVICLNGDVLSGVIHDQEWFSELLATQFSGALHTLIQAIGYAAQHFHKVTVHCTTGNHGRAMHKASKDRATANRWDSYETMLFTALKMVLSNKYKNVEVHIPPTIYALFKIQGHSILQVHGDAYINVGKPGKKIDMKGIEDQVNKVSTSILKEGESLAALLVAHVHTPTIQSMQNGCMLLINGCMIGIDPFAQSIGISGNNPTQTLFEVTKEHAVGDMRIISLKEADLQDRLDKIIKPFNGKY